MRDGHNRGQLSHCEGWATDPWLAAASIGKADEGATERIVSRKKAQKGRLIRRLDQSTSSSTFQAVTKFAEIEAAALRLTEKERLHLAGKLMGSVPPPFSAGSPDEIVAEASRRDAEIESGQAKPLSEDQFWAGVRRAQR